MTEIVCPENHQVGRVEYRIGFGENRKRLTIENLFYCPICKKFFHNVKKMVVGRS